MNKEFHEINCLVEKLNKNINIKIWDSLIIGDEMLKSKILREVIPDAKKLENLYRGSRDSFKAKIFH